MSICFSLFLGRYHFLLCYVKAKMSMYLFFIYTLFQKINLGCAGTTESFSAISGCECSKFLNSFLTLFFLKIEQQTKRNLLKIQFDSLIVEKNKDTFKFGFHVKCI